MGDYKGIITQEEYKGVITQSEYKGVLSITDPMTVIEIIAQEIASGSFLAEKVADCYPALFSMKKCHIGANKCLRLRRSSDDAESDFGFVSNEVDNAGIISWLVGADGYCKTWYDQSGNNNDAVQNDSSKQPQYDTSEKQLSFDGVNHYMDCGNNSNLNIGVGDFTAIVTLNPISTTRCIFKKQSVYSEGYIFAYHNLSGSGVMMQVYLNGNEYMTDSYYLPLNTMSNIAYIVRAGSTTYLDFYVDGVFKETKSTSDVGDINSSKPMQIGNAAQGGWGHFDGSMKNLIPVKYELTVGQIQNINDFIS